MTIQLLSTKTEIPPSRPRLVVRRHLLQRLDDGLASGKCLFLVSAPAGYGKTTLLVNWLTHLRAAQRADDVPATKLHPVWLALDDADNDPARFLGYLGAALRQADGDLARCLMSAIPLTDLPEWDKVLPVLVNEIAAFPDPVLLVLDDYHQISAQPVHDVVTTLLEFRPGNLHLVIATRADPPLPLARLRGCGQITEIRQHDLRFSVTEAGEFLGQVMGLALAAEQVAALASRTEGWIAGLQMAAVSLQGHRDVGDVAAFIHAFTGSHRHILDYLSEEVYRRQPADVRRFLVQTSILERFCAPLCSVVMAGNADPTGAESSVVRPAAVSSGDSARAVDTATVQQILEYLDRTNLFVVPLDDDRRWYRYHHLFADLLRQRLDQEEPGAAAGLHLRASQWFEQQQLVHEAIFHALAARSFDRAAQLMEWAAEAIMMASEVATLRSWLESLPQETLRAHPMLCVYEAGALLLASEAPEQAEARLRDAMQGGGHAIAGGPIAAYRALMAMLQGKEPQSMRLAHRALGLLPERSPYFRSLASLILALDTLFGGDDEVAIRQLREAQEMSDRAGNVMNSVLARCHLAELAMLHNRFAEAEQLYRDAVARGVDSGRPEPVGGFALLGLGIIQFERNELAGAQRALEEGIDLTRSWGQMGAIQGRVVLARVRRALGDATGAEAMLRAAEALLTRGPIPAAMLGPYVIFSRVRFSLHEGDLAAADRHARAAGLTLDAPSVERAPPIPVELCYEQLMRAQLLVAHGRRRDALHMLEALQRMAASQGRARLVFLALLEQSLVHRALGHQDRALEALGAALGLAESSGCIRMFVDAGEPMADLLRLALRHAVHPEFVTRLLAACAAEPAALAPTTELPPRSAEMSVASSSTSPSSGVALQPETSVPVLSPRELEVLDLAAQGLTNEEIALRLTVALSTVKTHINHICRKLEVPNRTAAAAKARRLRLLPDR
jgi:LuxR family maltose regulon positive regulatory protein